jgi:hypothetical protein
MLKNEALQFQFQPKKVEESELRKTCTSSYIYIINYIYVCI